MQTRRILLFFGIVLLLTAAAASFVPVPEEARQGEDEPATTEAMESRAPFARAGEDTAEVGFEAIGKPREATVEPNTRAVVTVEAREPGQVELEGLGLIESVEPGTPAVFDLFTDRAGRFEVLYSPVDGDEERVGTLIVAAARDRPQARDAADRGDP